MPVAIKLLMELLVPAGIIAVGGAGDVDRRLDSLIT